MQAIARILFPALALAVLLASGVRAEEKIIRMSTTTSTQASGLLDVLLPEFFKDTGIFVRVYAKGTGAALRDGRDGNVDVVLVHAPDREERFVENGFATRRYGVMHNDFVILGPASDPAGIRGEKNAATALEKIAGSASLFVSRGDDSGTHIKEQELWEKTRVRLKRVRSGAVIQGKYRDLDYLRPRDPGKWYLSIGQGMGRALTFAEEKEAYVLADRGTFLKYKHGREQGLDLVVLSEGDPLLFNPYGVLPINPAVFPHVRYDMARAFARWLVSPRAQKLIGDYRLEGRRLFVPDAPGR